MNELIPFHRPFPLTEQDEANIYNNIHEVIKSGQLKNGMFVRQLDDKIKELYKVKYCIATANATMGLYLCYKHYEYLGPLHLSNFTWPSFRYLLDQNIFVRFHDINSKTWLMREPLCGGVIMPTFTFGNTVQFNSITYQNKIINDGAHSLGVKLQNIGHATVFSLAATKIITSCEGGLVITNKKGLAEFVKEKRDKCCRMSEVHAIIGLQLLPHLKEVMDWKRKVFEYYSQNLSGQFQEIPVESNYNTIGFLNTESLKIPNTIEIKQYYQPLKAGFPNSDYVYSKIICLPSYYGCNYREVVKRIEEVNR